MLRLLAKTTARLANAALATIYLLDPERRELWSKSRSTRAWASFASPRPRHRRHGRSHGRADQHSGRLRRPALDPAVDRRTGHETRTLLTVPITSQDGSILGVFQVINSATAFSVSTTSRFFPHWRHRPPSPSKSFKRAAPPRTTTSPWRLSQSHPVATSIPHGDFHHDQEERPPLRYEASSRPPAPVRDTGEPVAGRRCPDGAGQTYAVAERSLGSSETLGLERGLGRGDSRLTRRRGVCPAASASNTGGYTTTTDPTARASPPSAAGSATSPSVRADFPAVGDWVALRVSADAGPAVIEAVLQRTNKLSRKSAGESGEEQLLAANLDVL